MSQDIKPHHAAIIIVFFIAVIVWYIWADGNMHATTGAGHMHRDHTGQVSIQTGNHILRFDSDGHYKNKLDLSEFGIDNLAGDFATYSDDSLLLSRLDYDPGPLDRIAITFRREELTRIESVDDGGLYNCDSFTFTCRLYDRNNVAYDQAFHLLLSPDEQQLYVADTSRNRILLLDSDGNELARNDDNWRYPNQMVLFDDRLYVVDTNNKSVRVIGSSPDDLGKTYNTIPIRDKRAIHNGHSWPAMLARIGDEWWITIFGNEMAHGGVYRYDNDWQYIDALVLPDDMDAFATVALDDSVLVSDLSNMRVYRFAFDGQRMADFDSPQLSLLLKQLEDERAQWQLLAYGALAVFALAFAIGTVIALVLEMKHGVTMKTTETITVSADDPDIQWLSHNASEERKFTWMVYAMAAMPVLLIAISYESGIDAFTVQLILISAMMIVAILIARNSLYRKRIGVLQDVLVIKDHKQRLAAARGESIRFTRSHLFVGNLNVLYNNPQFKLYDSKELIEFVYPLLKDATEITNGQGQRLMLVQRDPMLLMMLAVIVIMLMVVFAL